ncbi:hypothetical protein [Pseudarthrobacter sp. PS3-L1]|uniref:hypothetical protein n=1 Tax=Pseudarthrobacter sp. PS3-L1 TaxID=3046207 RepID=UPI0024BBE8DE|nr:hypothetical protein [Pseudarthrobacter sp. PS3-L1]MDJ0321968.1 hypothetical protein [Pseudarthrobacter sp. PS3-L1]
MRPTVWNPAGDWLSGLADDAMGNMAKAIMEALSQMVTTLSTFWVSMPTVNLASADGTGPSPVVATVNSELLPWTMTLAVFAVILGGTRMVWEQRGAPLKDILRSLITLVLVSGLGLGVISILVIAADAFSSAIIARSTNGKGFAESLQVLTMTGQTGVGVFILIILGLVGLLASIFQVVLMVVRSGMLVILAGILPTTAAFTNTEMGKQWFQKAVGWTIAFILYKPAAAIVYSVAFLLMGNNEGQEQLITSITGFALMIVALFALPALMKFVTPMVGALASGGGGGGAAGAAVGAVATGAVSMGRGGSGRGNASPTPASHSTSKTQSSSTTGSSSSPQGSGGTPGPQGGTGTPTPGGPGGSGVAGSAGAAGASTGAAAATSGAAGTSGAAAAGGGAAAAGGAAAGGAAAAAGPAGMAVSAGVQGAKKAHDAVKSTAEESTGEGPSGSN